MLLFIANNEIIPELKIVKTDMLKKTNYEYFRNLKFILILKVRNIILQIFACL
jgi:hypothetical protein